MFETELILNKKDFSLKIIIKIKEGDSLECLNAMRAWINEQFLSLSQEAQEAKTK